VLFPAGVHAGLVTMPVALALGEDNGLLGGDVLAAIVAGRHDFFRSEWLPWLQRNAGDLLPVGQLERVAALVTDLDALDDVSDLLRDLQPADGRSA
jgi:hypothetical protein